MREIPRRFILTFILAALIAHHAFAQDQSPPAPAQAESSTAPLWTEASETERATVTQLLESPDWPFRAFGLLRLEHYRGDEIESLLAPRLADEAWQVRCF
ncbi:MAG: hypothetical protein JSV91_05535, partial [Phycisphaerales bacterium]